jgi:hypothetical protein
MGSTPDAPGRCASSKSPINASASQIGDDMTQARIFFLFFLKNTHLLLLVVVFFNFFSFR